MYLTVFTERQTADVPADVCGVPSAVSLLVRHCRAEWSCNARHAARQVLCHGVPSTQCLQHPGTCSKVNLSTIA